jgi:hypothetical protein
VWVNKTLGPIPWWGWWPVSDSKHIVVSWDPAKTTMVSAKLRVDAIAVGISHLEIKVNDTRAIHLFWNVLEQGAKKMATSEDISSLLLNGDNLFFANLWKNTGTILEASVTFTATLVIEFEGTAPATGEKPEWQIWLETNWPLVAIGAGVVVLGGVAMGASSR